MARRGPCASPPDDVPAPFHIALIEGDDLILRLLQAWLSQGGHSTRTVGIQDIRAGDVIDLIVADVASAGAATRPVAQLRAAHAAPLLLMSARFHHGAAQSVAMAAQLGVDAVLPKPFTRDQLLAAVAAACAAGPRPTP